MPLFDDEPTELHPRVPERTTPPPVVSPPRPRPAPDDAESQMTLVNRVLDEQERIGTAAGKRVDSFLNRQRGGLFGVRPRGGQPTRPRTVREIAADREERRAVEEARHARHQRRMDMYEELKAVGGLLCIVIVFVILVMVGVFAFKIGIGDYEWGPRPVR